MILACARRSVCTRATRLCFTIRFTACKLTTSAPRPPPQMTQFLKWHWCNYTPNHTRPYSSALRAQCYSQMRLWEFTAKFEQLVFLDIACLARDHHVYVYIWHTFSLYWSFLNGDDVSINEILCRYEIGVRIESWYHCIKTNNGLSTRAGYEQFIFDHST